jgi:hypothetical protein
MNHRQAIAFLRGQTKWIICVHFLLCNLGCEHIHYHERRLFIDEDERDTVNNVHYPLIYSPQVQEFLSIEKIQDPQLQQYVLIEHCRYSMHSQRTRELHRLMCYASKYEHGELKRRSQFIHERSARITVRDRDEKLKSYVQSVEGQAHFSKMTEHIQQRMHFLPNDLFAGAARRIWACQYLQREQQIDARQIEAIIALERYGTAEDFECLSENVRSSKKPVVLKAVELFRQRLSAETTQPDEADQAVEY